MIGDIPTGDPFYTYLTQGGSVGILAVVVLAFARAWIVPGSEYRRVCSERDKALEQVYKQAEIAQRAMEVAERKGSR